MLNPMCSNCYFIGNECRGEQNQMYTGCIYKQKKVTILEHHCEGVQLLKWYLIDRNVADIKNIFDGEKFTGLTYRGVSAEDSDYLVFSDTWNQKNIDKMRKAEELLKFQGLPERKEVINESKVVY